MHQLSSPRIDPQILSKIEVDSLGEQARLASVPVPRERGTNRWVLWGALLVLLAIAVVAAVVVLL
jgi:hypothetical protein